MLGLERAQSTFNRIVNQMDFWKNKICVVTGATSGIGAAVALDLAKAGLQVIGLARRRERVEELARQSKGRLYAFECDISRSDSIVKVFKQIGERFGRVDILINMASRINKAPLDMSISNEDILKAIDINIGGVVICTREAYKLMQRHKEHAYIININSQGQSAPGQPETFATIPMKHMGSNEAKRIKITVNYPVLVRDSHFKSNFFFSFIKSVVPAMVKVELPETNDPVKDAKDTAAAAAAAKSNDSKFLQPKDVSDAVMYLLTTPQNVNVSFCSRFISFEANTFLLKQSTIIFNFTPHSRWLYVFLAP